MSTPTMTLGSTELVMPPLILHPFNERVPPSALLENSKAALMLSGLIPNDGSDQDELKRRAEMPPPGRQVQRHQRGEGRPHQASGRPHSPRHRAEAPAQPPRKLGSWKPRRHR